MIDLADVRTRFPERRVVWSERCETTMAGAAGLARAGCPSGTVFGAEEQTAGRGRHGRQWHSQPGAGLYVSIVLQPELPGQSLPAVSLALGLSAAEAIAHTTGLACDLRWPNDVLIGERKCAGVLVEAEGSFLIAGIGINVNQTAFPAEIAGLATSLRIASDRAQPREELLAQMLESVDRHMDLLIERGRDSVIEAFARASTYAYGKRVVVEQIPERIEGITDGLDPSGFLWVRQANGRRTLILAGGVRPAA